VNADASERCICWRPVTAASRSRRSYLATYPEFGLWTAARPGDVVLVIRVETPSHRTWILRIFRNSWAMPVILDVLPAARRWLSDPPSQATGHRREGPPGTEPPGWWSDSGQLVLILRFGPRITGSLVPDSWVCGVDQEQRGRAAGTIRAIQNERPTPIFGMVAVAATPTIRAHSTSDGPTNRCSTPFRSAIHGVSACGLSGCCPAERSAAGRAPAILDPGGEQV
jgi:hypothetical protein